MVDAPLMRNIVRGYKKQLWNLYILINTLILAIMKLQLNPILMIDSIIPFKLI
jgi:hypothetical protein